MRGSWLLGLVLIVSCGARTPLDDFSERDASVARRDSGPAGRDSGPPPVDACLVVRGAPISEPGATLGFPTLGRGIGGTMLAFTSEAGLGAEAHAVPLGPRGDALGPIQTVSSSRAGTVAGLRTAPIFGLSLKSPGSAVHGATLDANGVAIDANGPFGLTGQTRPALAIGDGIIATGWAETVATSMLMIGDEDTPVDGFLRIEIEGGEVHIAPMSRVGATVRVMSVTAGTARVDTVDRGGGFVDSRRLELVGGRVAHAVAVSNARDDGAVLIGHDEAGRSIVGAVHDGATHRIEGARRRGSAEDVAAAADALRMVVAASFVGDDGTGTLEVIGIRGDRVVTTVIDTTRPAHPAILAPARTGEPFLLVWEENRDLAVATVTCP